jgi:hypothetical protein
MGSQIDAASGCGIQRVFHADEERHRGQAGGRPIDWAFPFPDVQDQRDDVASPDSGRDFRRQLICAGRSLLGSTDVGRTRAVTGDRWRTSNRNSGQ